MGYLPSLAQLLWLAACHFYHCRATALHQPELLAVWHTGQEKPECAYPRVSWLWRGPGSGSECGPRAPFWRIEDISPREMRSRVNDLKDTQPTWRGNSKGKVACWESG